MRPVVAYLPIVKPVFLIGFMGTGKTTLGRALGAAAARGELPGVPPTCRYVDLDDYIEEAQRASVREIFARIGEDGFRQLEAEAIRTVAAQGDVIVGCGGGTPCHCGNMEWMLAHGLTVLLEASPEVLLRRLLEAQDQRPLLRGLTPPQLVRFIADKQAERAPFYERARCRFPSDLLESEAEIASSVAAFASLLSSLP